nr:MAG TPA: Receptor Binding Protein [Caudoviricetes sp.]
MNTTKINTPLEYGFFNCADGTEDRVYTAENFTGYLSAIICDGILDTWGDCFSLSYSDTSLTIGTGYAWIGGHYAILAQPQIIDVSAYADTGLSRMIAVGISCDTASSVRACSFEVAAGLAGSSDKPAFTGTDTKKYLTLCYIKLAAGGAIDSLQDVRDDETLCGYCKCILGKCRVTEMLAEMAKTNATLDELQKRLDEMNSQITEMQTKVDDLTAGEIVATGQCGENVYYVLYDSGKLLLRGSGATYDYEISGSPFYENGEIKKLVVSEGITEIGNSLFDHCRNIAAASFPNTLTRIGKRAFFAYADGELAALEIPSSVTTIGDEAFSDQGMTSVTLPKTLTTLGTYLFRSADNLQSVRVECAEIPAFCFVSCGKLSQMTLSKNVKKIGANIINYCTQLKTITYEGSLEEWKEVEKYANWDGNSGSTNPGYLDNIVCIDGTMVYDRDNKTWNEVKS